MAPRRASARSGRATAATRDRAQGGIRKNTRNRQAPTRYGQHSEGTNQSSRTQTTIDTKDTASSSEEEEPSTQHYSHSHLPIDLRSTSQLLSANSPARHARITALQSQLNSNSSASNYSDLQIHLNTMSELVRSHEEDIVERVVQRLGSQNSILPKAPTSNILAQHPAALVNRPSQDKPTIAGVTVLESKLARQREQGIQNQIISNGQRAIGMFKSNQPLPLQASEGALAIGDSVEVLIAGVERATLVQTMEKRCKPTNIYPLLASV